MYRATVILLLLLYLLLHLDYVLEVFQCLRDVPEDQILAVKEPRFRKVRRIWIQKTMMEPIYLFEMNSCISMAFLACFLECILVR